MADSNEKKDVGSDKAQSGKETGTPVMPATSQPCSTTSQSENSLPLETTLVDRTARVIQDDPIGEGTSAEPSSAVQQPPTHEDTPPLPDAAQEVENSSSSTPDHSPKASPSIGSQSSPNDENSGPELSNSPEPTTPQRRLSNDGIQDPDPQDSPETARAREMQWKIYEEDLRSESETRREASPSETPNPPGQLTVSEMERNVAIHKAEEEEIKKRGGRAFLSDEDSLGLESSLSEDEESDASDDEAQPDEAQPDEPEDTQPNEPQQEMPHENVESPEQLEQSIHDNNSTSEIQALLDKLVASDLEIEVQETQLTTLISNNGDTRISLIETFQRRLGHLPRQSEGSSDHDTLSAIQELNQRIAEEDQGITRQEEVLSTLRAENEGIRNSLIEAFEARQEGRESS